MSEKTLSARPWSEGITDFEKNQALAELLDAPGDWPGFMDEARAAGVRAFPSADHPDDDPAPPFSEPTKPAHRQAWLVAGRAEILQVLRDPATFGNAAYAQIGGSAFMLALDPGVGAVCGHADAHARQRAYVDQRLQAYTEAGLKLVASEATRQATVAALSRNRFDLAALAELCALRMCQLWFGFSSDDIGLLQAAAADGYSALVHQIVGRHFTSDATVLARARVSMARLTRRCAELLGEYRRLGWRAPEDRIRLPRREARLQWPDGVDPPDEWGLSAMGDPLLKRMALQPGDFSVQELAAIAVGLVVGTVGNVQAGVCLVMRRLMHDSAAGALQRAQDSARHESDIAALRPHVIEGLAAAPPVAFLPRRATRPIELAGCRIKAGDDLVLWLAAAGHADTKAEFAFGAEPQGARHACLGQPAGLWLTTAVVHAVLRLPGLAEVLDPVTGEPVGLEQRWGFACVSYPWTHTRARRLAQQPLNVVMRVKAPVELHAEAIRRVIRSGAARIELALARSRHVHFAWFELLDQGRSLALHTVYDGTFDGYIEHFALEVDDLFDRLFEHIEGAPPLPVAEHPGAFVDVIRACNQAPVEGYFFSAYPRAETPDIVRHQRGQP